MFQTAPPASQRVQPLSEIQDSPLQPGRDGRRHGEPGVQQRPLPGQHGAPPLLAGPGLRRLQGLLGLYGRQDGRGRGEVGPGQGQSSTQNITGQVITRPDHCQVRSGHY